MITLVTGGNSYATLDEFKAYIAMRPWGDVFNGIADETLKKYLVGAFDAISVLSFENSPVTVSDAGIVIQPWAKVAQYLEALHLFIYWSDSDTKVRMSLRLNGVSSFSIDKASESISRRLPTVAGLFSQEAFRLLKPNLVMFANKLRHDV